MSGEFSPEDIGIVVPFTASVQYIRHQLRQAGLAAVEVGTVHTYQGREKDFIIFDTVMSVDKKSGKAFTVRNLDQTKTSEDQVRRLMNVALSRCRKVLFLVSNLKHFQQQYTGQFITGLLESLQNAAVETNLDNAAAEYDNLTIEEQVKKVEHVEPAAKTKPVTEQVQSSVDPKTAKTIKKYGNEIDALRFDINSLSANKKNSALFTPGSKVADFMDQISVFAVTDEDSFEHWIKNMQMYFYESCGGSDAQFPVINKQNKTFKIRWQINKLRVGFAHDIEQFTDEEQDKIYGVYEDLIGVRRPREDREWTAMQLAVMARTIAWLKLVLQCIKQN